MDELPYISIQSALEVTSAKIIVGYLNESDCDGLPKDNRISFINLSKFNEKNTKLDGNYSAFDSKEFYEIVEFKWNLLLEVLELEHSFVIYSDTDVIWIKDPIPMLVESFEKYKAIELFIQSDTRRPNYLVPCMGFLAIRNCESIKLIFEECRNLHRLRISQNQFIGDDEIIKEILEKYDNPFWFQELPQISFPVGIFYGLFLKRMHFPNLLTPQPYIFHANYVVGMKSKKFIMRKIGKLWNQNDFHLTTNISMQIEFYLRRIYSNIKFKRNLKRK